MLVYAVMALIVVAPFVVLFGRPSGFRDICKLVCAGVAPIALAVGAVLINDWVDATYYPAVAAADPLNSLVDHPTEDPSVAAYRAAVEEHLAEMSGAPAHAAPNGN